ASPASPPPVTLSVTLAWYSPCVPSSPKRRVMQRFARCSRSHGRTGAHPLAAESTAHPSSTAPTGSEPATRRAFRGFVTEWLSTTKCPPAARETGSVHALTGRRAAVGREQEDVFAARSGGDHHAFAHTEFHLPRCEVRDDHHEAPDQIFGLICRLDAGEHRARDAAPEAH